MVLATVVCGYDDVVTHRAQCMALEPEQHRGLGQPLLPLEMLPMQGDTAITLGRTGTEDGWKRACQVVGRLPPAFGLASPLQGEGWRKRLVEHALRRRGVGELADILVGLLELQRRARQGAWVSIHPPLNIAMALHEMQSAFALGTGHGVVVTAQAWTDRVDLRGDAGAPCVREHVFRGAIASARGLQHHPGDPTRFRGGHGARQHGAGIP
jgi:hypothetical protein